MLTKRAVRTEFHRVQSEHANALLFALRSGKLDAFQRDWVQKQLVCVERLRHPGCEVYYQAWERRIVKKYYQSLRDESNRGVAYNKWRPMQIRASDEWSSTDSSEGEQ